MGGIDQHDRPHDAVAAPADRADSPRRAASAGDPSRDGDETHPAPSPSAGIAQVRSERSRSTHARTLATVERILDAACDLARGGERISVAAVCRRAGIGRATFYTHFDGLEAVAMRLNARALEDAAEVQAQLLAGDGALSSRDAQLAVFVRFAQHVRDNAELYRALFSLPLDSSARNTVLANMSDALLARMRAETQPPPGIDAGITAAALAAGFMQILSRWILEDMPWDADLVARHFGDLMPDWALDGREAG